MSPENVERVWVLNEAWNAGNWDAVRDVLDPGVVVRPNDDWPERGPFLGLDAVMRWYEQLRDTWDSVNIETVSQTDAHDRVIGVGGLRLLRHDAHADS